jgi:GNAT superfamily N-acetyltransferase
MLGRVETITDGQGGRALVFLDACGTPGVGAVGDIVHGRAGALRLLWTAERLLREAGMHEAVGPLDGNTFFAYRACVGDVSSEPMFASEPSLSPSPFRCLGWREEARYRTTRCPNGPQLTRERPLPPGWRVRQLDVSRLGDELAALYQVTCAAFAEAHRYSPVPLDVFARLYAPSHGRVDTRFVLLAEDPDGRVQGYVYAWPEPEHGRFVLKTLAVHPDARGARVATHLMARVHAQAESLGLSYGLHALMWEGSLSRAITAHGGLTVRQYALYRKRLA